MRSPNPTSRGQIQPVAAIALGLIASVGLAAPDESSRFAHAFAGQEIQRPDAIVLAERAPGNRRPAIRGPGQVPIAWEIVLRSARHRATLPSAQGAVKVRIGRSRWI
jgi:hypothetical protein